MISCESLQLIASSRALYLTVTNESLTVEPKGSPANSMHRAEQAQNGISRRFRAWNASGGLGKIVRLPRMWWRGIGPTRGVNPTGF